MLLKMKQLNVINYEIIPWRCDARKGTIVSPYSLHKSFFVKMKSANEREFNGNLKGSTDMVQCEMVMGWK
jgi:hypothetical protein